MNEQLQSALVTIINRTLQGVDTTISFLSSELPDVINQLLLWKAIESFLLFFFVGILGSIATIYINYKQFLWWKMPYPYQEDSSYTNWDANCPFVMLNALQYLWLAFLYKALFHLDWLQIIIAPKVWLLEYAAKLVK